MVRVVLKAFMVTSRILARFVLKMSYQIFVRKITGAAILEIVYRLPTKKAKARLNRTSMTV